MFPVLNVKQQMEVNTHPVIAGFDKDVFVWLYFTFNVRMF
ncbi:hypothetical protein CLV60_10117 [Dyadobacter jiangsuensis]|uniref:Uncharacterized protein n=1 Tax=Dyadobacter jiangsuensis TaxID=1591085 RepID=A0A2P8GI67_9BACT|nr:hypothetical protein CLV60_10117 [Dyadobacter jiangsuensis]